MKIYRLVVDESSYRYTQADYDKYVVEMNRYHRIPLTAIEMRDCHLKDAREDSNRIYTSATGAKIKVGQLKRYNPWFDFNIEEAEPEWKQI